MRLSGMEVSEVFEVFFIASGLKLLSPLQLTDI